MQLKRAMLLTSQPLREDMRYMQRKVVEELPPDADHGRVLPRTRNLISDHSPRGEKGRRSPDLDFSMTTEADITLSPLSGPEKTAMTRSSQSHWLELITVPPLHGPQAIRAGVDLFCRCLSMLVCSCMTSIHFSN